MLKAQKPEYFFRFICKIFFILGRGFLFRKMDLPPCLIVLVLMFFIPLHIHSAHDTYVLQRIKGSIILDGISDEPGWRGIEPRPMIMYEPTYKGTISERTEILVAYDDDYLYAAGRFFDSDPSEIRVTSLYRDRIGTDDTFTIIIDTFNDKENALIFSTNPAGVRMDAAISLDGRAINGSWNTFWDVATIHNEQGWFAEMRIPFSSLGFQRQGDKVFIGLIALRYIGRKNEQIVYPDISPNWSIFTPSQAQKVELSGVESKKPVYFTPYVLGGFGQDAVLNEPGTAYEMDSQWSRSIGLDVKYNMTHNLTLDLTVNTDFSQVEADDQMVNLTRFSLFFPEKRRFFQERSGLFLFNTSSTAYNRVFHSRRIGLHQGSEVPILGGVRMVGRVGAWDVGFIEMQTAKTDELASENFGVFRLRRQVINPYSYVGTIFTSRVDFKGNHNFVFGMDGIIRMFGDEYLILKWAQTFDSDLPKVESKNFLDSAALFALWQRRSQTGLGYMVAASRSGKHFNPEVGAIARVDFTELSWSLSYEWLQGEDSPFREVSPIQFFGHAVFRNEDRKLESAQFEYDTDFYWKSGASIWADLELHYEDLQEDLPFPEDTEIPAGSYTFCKIEGGYNMGSNRLLRGFFSVGLGSFYDGWRTELGVAGVWNPSRHIGLFAEYDVNFIRFSERDQHIDAHIMRLRVQSALNNKLALNGYIQFNSVYSFLAWNLRFRYNFAEGKDLWLVFNQGLFSDRTGGDILLPACSDRTILLKFTYTFTSL
jgi:hypothetical protein